MKYKIWNIKNKLWNMKHKFRILNIKYEICVHNIGDVWNDGGDPEWATMCQIIIMKISDLRYKT